MKIQVLKYIIFLLAFTSVYSVKAQKGEIYSGFPESFENSSELSPDYKKKTVKFNTGDWFFFGARVDSTGNDRPTTGKFAARFVGNNTVPALLQMNFDLKGGASKVTFWFSSYGAKADKPSKFQLEYSLDAGKNWKKIGEEIDAVSKTKQLATFEMDIKGTVRFRISKLGLGVTNDTISNGRMSIDDFTVYKN